MSEQKFKTTDGPALKIWNSFKKNAISFGEPVKEDNDVHTSTEWKANTLSNGANISMLYKKIKGLNKAGKERNPRYWLILSHNGKTKKFSGPGARKVYERLIKGTPKKRTNKITEETSNFCVDALSDL